MNEQIITDITIRAKPKTYVTFSPADNKDMFRSYYRHPNKQFGSDMQHVSTHTEDYWAVYKVEHGIAWLVCVFTKREEVSAQALEIVLKDYPHLLKDGVI